MDLIKPQQGLIPRRETEGTGRPRQVYCVSGACSPMDCAPVPPQVKPLAIRHIKYGATAQSVKHFGTVLHNVLRVALGDKYDEASQKAWHYVWNRCARTATTAARCCTGGRTRARRNRRWQRVEPHRGLTQRTEP